MEKQIAFQSVFQGKACILGWSKIEACAGLSLHGAQAWNPRRVNHGTLRAGPASGAGNEDRKQRKRGQEAQREELRPDGMGLHR